ncbi:MAG: 3-methyl-2-oxobutanoate hydroxymethyltransferase, partial [Actinomycetota bacterium]|nr:3-methyl-2-oxobutanoate hydroxymethyltransferase [Actinomycetota bacterium]
MPFMTFQISAEEALRNAGVLIAQGGAGAVKLEGGVRVAATVAKIVEAGIPVMGHVGLTPQSVHQFGGYRVQAKQTSAALELIEDCRALEAAGAFAIVLECIPTELAAVVSREISIPTIGIGAGGGCDGQVQVFHDLVGMGGDFTPRHAKRYAEIGDTIRVAVEQYAQDVRDGAFPQAEQSTAMDPQQLAEFKSQLTSGSNEVAGGDAGTKRG